MKKRFLFTFFLIISCLNFTHIYAQIGPYDTACPMPTTSLYDSDVMNASIKAAKERYQRRNQISEAVQPFRERQIQYYREGRYRAAVDLCNNVYRQYVYFVYENKAISDMEILAGDCALKIRSYEEAIEWYRRAYGEDEKGMNYKLSNVFNVVIDDARNAYKSSNFPRLWDIVSIAQKTGKKSGECYYYYGVCYEKSNNYRDAKKMYKRAKNLKYAPAISALEELKKKIKSEKKKLKCE